MSKLFTEIFKIDPSCGKARINEFSDAISFLEKSNIETESQNENKINQLLLNLSKENQSESGSISCLRCFISHSIVEKINVLFRNYSEDKEIEMQDMLSFVLNDSGERYFYMHKKTHEKKLRYLFNWENIYNSSPSESLPLSSEIILEFNPSLSGLSTWTKNKVNANIRLKKYFASHGILLQTPWSLIADSSPKRVKEAWLRCGRGKMKINEVINLHNSYLIEYKKAKLIYKTKTGKISGWNPDIEFLEKLNPIQKNLDNLKLIDESIREYLFGINKPRQFEEGEEEKIENSIFEDYNDKSYKKNLNQIIDNSLKENGLNLTMDLLNQDRKKWLKDPSRELAWQLYSQGLSQREIALKCSHKQSWVSKLIPEKKIAEIISQEVSIELIKISEFSSLRRDPEGIDRMALELRNHLLNQELNDGINIRSFINENLTK